MKDAAWETHAHMNIPEDPQGKCQHTRLDQDLIMPCHGLQNIHQFHGTLRHTIQGLRMESTKGNGEEEWATKRKRKEG
eukprot:3477442-Prorocentrum_lima.AAC.1